MAQLKQVTLATELAAVEQEIASIEEQLEPLMQRKEELRKQLLENLKRQGVRQVKLDSGILYVRAQKTTLKVVDEFDALEWAAQHNCLKPDTTKAWKILKLNGESDKLPPGFERQDTEYLSVRTLSAQHN